MIIINDKELLKDFYIEQGYKVDIENVFFYDETNNPIKIQFKSGKELNLENLLNKYRLGGITLDKENISSIDWNNFFDSLELKTELKLKQINDGKTDTFTNCLRGKRLKKILTFLINNKIYIHCSSFDNIYDIIIEIVDSLLLEKYSQIYDVLHRVMKDELYIFVTKNIEKFIDILKRYNYPNITGENIKEFCEEMSDWIEKEGSSEDFGLETCRQLFKEYKKRKNLIFLKDNKDKVIIDGYYGMNLDMCSKFSRSHHCFDEITEIQEILKELNLENCSFENSEKSIQLQLSDVIVGLLNRFFDFIDSTPKKEIESIIQTFNRIQKENLELFLKLYYESVEKNELFMCFYEPISIVENRNKIIMKLIQKQSITSEYI